MARYVRCLIWSIALLTSGLACAQQVTMSKTSTIYSEPNPGSSKVAEVKEGTAVEVLGRQGAFANVKSAAGTGWVFAFNVNFGGASATTASAGAARKPPGNTTIGIRGLDKEDMKNAQFDGKQLDALDAFADGDKGAADKGAAGKGTARGQKK